MANRSTHISTWLGAGLALALVVPLLLHSAEPKAAKRPKASATAEPKAPKGPPPWAPFVEPDFPFFSSVLDARKMGGDWPTNNLTPRGLILNLGNDCWACFDTDLLRVSAIWTGKGVTAVSMAQGSYQVAGEKAPEGQATLPRMEGKPWMTTGVYPGWQVGEHASTEIDPREPCPDPKEVGRGPIDPALGQFKAVRFIGTPEGGVVLEYTVAGARVREWIAQRTEEGRPVILRRFWIERVDKQLWLLLGNRPRTEKEKLKLKLIAPPVDGESKVERADTYDFTATLKIKPSAKPVDVYCYFSLGEGRQDWKGLIPDPFGRTAPSPTRWPRTVEAKAELSAAKDAYVLDRIGIPVPNPWKRNVRLCDIAFFKDGRAAAVTYDGDVWMIDGLKGDLDGVKWRRFTSGFHEPLGLCIRNDEVFVFDRNGIWRPRDTNGDGEADVHEMFSNAFAQTAETREFASGIEVAPDGSFIIAKGGQQGTTLGKHNGTVLRVSADGKSSEVLGWGLRGPWIGVNPKTGLVTASDQQGHYVPATPLHVIRDHQYYGYLALFQPKEEYPASIADPLTWIPHPVNSSGASQVWLVDAKMGPLNDALIHIGYNRPEVFLVRMSERGTRPQAAVMSLTRELSFGSLNGAVGTGDGQLYVIGMQIWGTVAKDISGLVRIRYTGAPSTFPREVVPMDKGVLLKFDVELDAKEAVQLGNFSIERWGYKRTASYGSPHYREDGSKGQEVLAPSSVYVSKDGRSVFIGVPDLKPVMQMRVGWALKTKAGAGFANNAYFTPYEFPAFEPVKEGFDNLTVDLTPRTLARAVDVPVTADEGAKIAELMGCVACHSNDGSTLGKVGPTWKGLFGSERLFVGGAKAVADEAYLRESIKEPAVKVVKGFEKNDTGMPSYEGVITDAQINALVMYIKTLK